MQRDNEIFDIIDREHLRQRRGIELIASENFVSDEVMRAMGSCLTNKYAEGYPAKRYYGGCQVVDEAENLAIERAKKLFGAEWANVQPHSGRTSKYGCIYGSVATGRYIHGNGSQPRRTPQPRKSCKFLRFAISSDKLYS